MTPVSLYIECTSLACLACNGGSGPSLACAGATKGQGYQRYCGVSWPRYVNVPSMRWGDCVSWDFFELICTLICFWKKSAWGVVTMCQVLLANWVRYLMFHLQYLLIHGCWARSLAAKFVKKHAIRQGDICKRTSGSGSYRRWMPGAILKAALLGLYHIYEIWYEWRFSACRID